MKKTLLSLDLRTKRANRTALLAVHPEYRVKTFRSLQWQLKTRLGGRSHFQSMNLWLVVEEMKKHEHSHLGPTRKKI